jgi:hypothetical protein
MVVSDHIEIEPAEAASNFVGYVEPGLGIEAIMIRFNQPNPE